ncbi:conserved hypothetical protein [uncultured Sporomusa sp.]|uniref:DUF4391 domain-containing protein n=1 Tax=uncultured Sporomusa sp. TaxID=307249 RepID=A0A212LYI7_9FIRM|nr:DUF4391 domain-containing protein [uncultured Sporomusa sp.]SCM82591.1 conserved hypothetical protein [uncultured Sporomusa sp.]
MLGLPSSTEVNRRVAKEKFYANGAMTTQVRDRIKDQIESIIWRNKLADSTMGIAAGETVKEIQVFEVVLRQRELDKRVLVAIVKAIPYKLVFVLSFGDEAQVWMETSGAFYNTAWLLQTELTLQFAGLNLDAMYDNLVRQIAAGRLDGAREVAEAVELDKQRQKLERDIATLEKKILSEKQFNRQVELNGELKRLRAVLEELK